MKPDARNIIIAVCVATVLGAVLGGLALRSCSHPPDPTVVWVNEIDAGPGEQLIAERLDAQVQADEAQIRELEERNQRALDQFDEQQQAEYDQVRRQGRRAVAAWLSDYNTVLKTDAGTP